MEKLLDLDAIHRRDHISRVRNIIIGTIVLAITAVGAITLLDNNHKPVNTHLATVSMSSQPPNSSNESSANNSQQAQNSTSSTSSQVAQEQAQEQQDEEQASKDEEQAQADINSSQNISSVPLTQTVSAPTSAPFVTPYSISYGAMSGTYHYAIAFLTSTGTQTSLGPVSLGVSPNDQEVWLSNIPTGNSNVVARKIYRTKDNGSIAGPFYLDSIINNNTATDFYDNTPDSSLSGIFTGDVQYP